MLAFEYKARIKGKIIHDEILAEDRKSAIASLKQDKIRPINIKEKKIKNYTHAWAQRYGWLWQIPTQQRLGCVCFACWKRQAQCHGRMAKIGCFTRQSRCCGYQ